MKHSDSITNIATAFCAMQSRLKPATKDLVNPAFNSKYSDINSCWDSAREPLTQNGLCVVQDIVNDGQFVQCTTMVIHSSGEWFSFGPFSVSIQKNTAHAIGSAVSYAKRYSFCAALGITSGDSDDDGNEHSDPNFKPAKKQVPLVTKEQIDVLVDLFNLLNKDNQNVALRALRENGVEKFVQLPSDHFDGYARFLSSLKDNEQKQFAEEVQNV